MNLTRHSQPTQNMKDTVRPAPYGPLPPKPHTNNDIEMQSLPPSSAQNTANTVPVRLLTYPLAKKVVLTLIPARSPYYVVYKRCKNRAQLAVVERCVLPCRPGRRRWCANWCGFWGGCVVPFDQIRGCLKLLFRETRALLKIDCRAVGALCEQHEIRTREAKAMCQGISWTENRTAQMRRH
jgi:hypothetical protein